MKNKLFIDTNILLYSIDKFDKAKQKKARSLLKKIALESEVVISTQVIQEFYVAGVKKLNANPQILKELIKDFEKFEIIQISIELIKEAVDFSLLNKISFWDALIVTTAETSGCKVIFTEDLNSGQMIKGVKIINPFNEL